MKHRFYSIKFKFLLPVALVTLLLAAGMVWKSSSLLQEQVEIRELERARSVAHSLVFAAENGNDLSVLQRFIASMSAEGDIELVMLIRKTDGHIWASSKLGWVNKKFEEFSANYISPAVRQLIFNTNQEKIQLTDQHLTIGSPMFFNEEAQSGMHLSGATILVVFSRESIQKEQASIRQDMTFRGLFNISMVFVTVAFVLYYVVLRPVSNLTETLRIHQAGNLQHEAKVLANDELGFVATELNSLTRQIIQNETFLIESKQKAEHAERLVAANEARLKAVLDNAPAAIFLKDVDGKYLLVNNEFEKLVQQPQNALIGKTDLECLSETIVQAFNDRGPVSIDNVGPQTHEAEIEDENGISHTFVYSTSPILDDDGSVAVICGVATDITGQKKTEKQLETYANDLARSNQELNDFAYIASHDLKEPLRGINNYATFLIEDYADKIDEEGQKKLHTLTKLTGRLQQLIDSLLFYSRVGQEEINLQPVNIDELVGTIKEDLQGRIEELNGEIIIPKTVGTFNCDPLKTREIILNLITNGLKYNSSEKPIIEIGIQTSKSHDKTVFYVKDNGIGIRAHNIENIFGIFKRLHGRDKYGGGTGAGLTIVKKMVEQHGGNIWVESVYGEGTTFLFTLT